MSARKAGTSLVQWDQQLLADANLARAAEESVMLGSFLSLRGGQISFNGNVFPGNKVNVIVLDSVLENVYYTGKFDPDSPSTPICYAFGRIDTEMKPHDKAPEPQHEKCKGCPENEWESGDRGRGKACKNSRRLALVLADDATKTANTMADAQIAYLRVPVTSVKAWAGYVTQLANVTKKPPYAVVTEIAVTPDPKTQFKVSFKLVRDIRETQIQVALLKRVSDARASIIFPYAVRDPSAAGSDKKGVKKKFRRGG